jgi:DNA-binding transcriptional MerR regulator
MEKSADAFRTISEAAGELELPQHVLRFWETRFPQIKPLKRAGGRRYYRPRDIECLRLIKHLLYGEGYTIKGVPRVLKEQDAGVLAAPAMAPAGRSTSPPLPAQPILKDRPASERGSTGAKDAARRNDALAFAAADIERLQAALTELAECSEILGAARRT